MPSPTDRNLTALPTKTVKPTRRRQTRHFTQLDQVTQLVARARRGPGSGLHGAAARALLAAAHQPKKTETSSSASTVRTRSARGIVTPCVYG